MSKKIHFMLLFESFFIYAYFLIKGGSGDVGSSFSYFFKAHQQQLSQETIEVYKKTVAVFFLRLQWFCCCCCCWAAGTSSCFMYNNPDYLQKCSKSLVFSQGTSQRQSGCQESAVDRGCGRILRPLLGLVVVVLGQLYNCEETCTFAEMGRELNLTLLVGTTSFARIHSSSRL